ncbi:hypothetical protein L7F22_061239 [Adiantum nelumboides]|nr:hypothetical protein [Adiantum nelumboides]
METPAEEIDLLLEEIPRATSAPPHFKTSTGASQGLPAPYLPDALFERKLPSSFSDSHVMSLAENPNPNPNPNATHSPSSNQSPSITPRIPQASPKQQSLAAYRESRLLGGDEPIVGNALASLSLQEKDTDSLQMLLDNRNKVYTPNSLLQDFSGLNPASPASYVNQLPYISSTPAPSMMKSLSVPASHASMLHPFADATFLDRPYPQDLQMNHEPFPSSDGFCMESPFLEDERALSLLRAKSIMMRQGIEPHKAEQLASQQGYDWNPPLQKGSYLDPLIDELCDHPALPLAVSKQPGCRAFHNKDTYGNCLTTSSPEFAPDGHLLALIQQQKLQLARQSIEEKLHMQQLHSGLNAGLYDQLRYAKKKVKYPSFMTDLQDLQYSPGSASPAYESALLGNDTNCRFYAQGHCIRGSTCPFLHPTSYEESGPFLHSSKESFAGAAIYDKLGALAASQAFQQWRPQSNGSYSDLAALSAGRRRREKAGLLAGNGEGLLHLDDRASAKAFLDESSESLQQLLKFTNLEDLEGRIFSVAKDQHGCRFLQRKLDEAKPEDVEMIFQEIKEHVVQLMTDPFGNYLVQKLLDACNELHRSAILEAVTKNDDLINISLNMHGTRAVQKLIETLQTPDQTAMLISCLKRGVVTLIKDLNGNHVVQRCLQRLENDNNQFIFDAAASHCVEIASHRHGCCVLQRCVDFASGVQQRQLVTEIAANALALSQDQYGNYVVQYILELGLPWAMADVVSRLEGSIPHLAMQKFSSNVVEKCLKVATEESKSIIVKELVSSSVLSQLLQDPYANYVIQSALQVTKGHLHASVIDAIKPHVHVLRSSPYGKRILSRTQFKK